MTSVLTYEEARRQNRCRICGKRIKTVPMDNPLILNYGKEYAHYKCMKTDMPPERLWPAKPSKSAQERRGK